MHIEDLRQIHDTYEQIYIAPHLDDAALSCGGAILAHTAAGQRTLVVTLCTGTPPADGPFSELARTYHAQWGLSPAEVVTARLREDARAMELLGTDWYWAGMADAIYRQPDHYNSGERLFGPPAPDDQLLPAVRQLLATLADRAPRAALCAPLAVGWHVDHQLTLAAVQASRLSFHAYEDVPYVLHAGALERRMAELGGHPLPMVSPIGATLAGKLDAVACYASQLNALFGPDGEHAMRRQLTDYAATLHPDGGERRWSLVA